MKREKMTSQSQKQQKNIIEAINRQYELWLKKTDAWAESPKAQAPTLADKIESLLFSLEGRGGNRQQFEWMMGF